MRKPKILSLFGIMAVCVISMAFPLRGVSAAELIPAEAASAENIPVPEALPVNVTPIPETLPVNDVMMPNALPANVVPVDHETALLQAAQMEIVLQGLPLDKYHVINVLGDSLTQGVGARSADKAYPAVLARLTGARVNNYGLASSRITDIESGDNESNPPSFIDRMYSMDKSADLILVFGGTNDFWYGDCPIGTRTDTGVNTFYGALNTMMPYLKNAHPNADIVFVIPYQQSKGADETHTYNRSTYNDFGTGTLNQYRIALLDRCQYYGLPALDLYMDYDLNTVDNREALEKYGNYLCDGCHLNDAGYNLLARKIYRFIMQDFGTYVPDYTEINDMVFETAALPCMINGGSFVMPNGVVIPSKPGFEVDWTMPLPVLYRLLIANAYY